MFVMRTYESVCDDVYMCVVNARFVAFACVRRRLFMPDMWMCMCVCALYTAHTVLWRLLYSNFSCVTVCMRVPACTCAASRAYLCIVHQMPVYRSSESNAA
eukprot:GDKI01035840.1.p2 GENE.GDKI01035840.1~~GDKI01035840.1.p2  ORF type:complete len:101 (-),score=8.85 GDKI01035840.1:91-393(-)